MTDDVCEQCGASNGSGARFCRACDAYLGWDKGATTIGGHPVVGTVPQTLETVPTGSAPMTAGNAVAAPAVTGSPAPPPPPDATTRTRPAPLVDTPDADHVEVPRVRLRTAAATILPDAAATVTVEAYNGSSIVDGFTVTPVDAPAWLDVTHEPVRLMPRQDGVLELSLGMRSGVLVLAQRFTQRLVVSSEADPAKTAELRLAITVPAVGPPITLTAQPRMLRLTDGGRARFVVHADNRAANFAQSFHLSGSDPEGVVQFGFLPADLQVPPGQLVEVRAHFVAPLPEPGRDSTRQLTISATNDEGTVTTDLTVVQHTSPAPEHVPVTLRLAPRELRVTNAVVADFEIHIDNRAGHAAADLALTARDPARRLSFSLAPERVSVPAGEVAVAHGRVRAAPAPRGQTATHPFTVVTTDGVADVEAPGVLEVTTTPAPLTTADLRVTPRNLTRADDRRGTFAVEVDNVRGQETLVAWLSGADSHGMARLTFEPSAVTVPPGGVARVRMVVDSPRPPRGETAAREVRVVASDGEGRLEADATFTQVSSDRRPLLRILLVLCGAFLVLLGAFLPWFLVFGGADGLDLAEAAVQVTDAQQNARLIAAASLRAMLAVLALAMVFGLTGRAGSLTRKSALLAVLLTVAYVITVVSLGTPFTLSAGLALVALGSVLAYIGGVLARQE